MFASMQGLALGKAFQQSHAYLNSLYMVMALDHQEDRCELFLSGGLNISFNKRQEVSI